MLYDLYEYVYNLYSSQKVFSQRHQIYFENYFMSRKSFYKYLVIILSLYTVISF